MEQQRNKVSYALPIFILMKLLRFVISPHNLDFIAFLILISSIGILMEAICWIFMQVCCVCSVIKIVLASDASFIVVGLL
jgi:hypothetical protein